MGLCRRATGNLASGSTTSAPVVTAEARGGPLPEGDGEPSGTLEGREAAFECCEAGALRRPQAEAHPGPTTTSKAARTGNPPAHPSLGASRQGNTTLNVDPTPTSDASSMRPCNASTISFTIDNPSPIPRVCLWGTGSICSKGSKMRS